MASRRSRGKTRFERRRAHAVLTRGRPGLIAEPYVVADIVSPTVTEAKKTVTFQRVEKADPPQQHHALSSVPVRAQCPECGFSQKVKRDGTMGRHDVGTETKRQCAGTGRKWND